MDIMESEIKYYIPIYYYLKKYNLKIAKYNNNKNILFFRNTVFKNYKLCKNIFSKTLIPMYFRNY